MFFSPNFKLLIRFTVLRFAPMHNSCLPLSFLMFCQSFHHIVEMTLPILGMHSTAPRGFLDIRPNYIICRWFIIDKRHLKLYQERVKLLILLHFISFGWKTLVIWKAALQKENYFHTCVAVSVGVCVCVCVCVCTSSLSVAHSCFKLINCNQFP